MTAKEKANLIVNRITSWAPWSHWYDVSRREIEIKITIGLEEYAKDQAIAFVKYNCPDIKFDDALLNAGYAGFLIHQHQQQNKE